MDAFKEFCKNMLLGKYTQAAVSFFYQIAFVLGVGISASIIAFHMDRIETKVQEQQLETQKLINVLAANHRQAINEMYLKEITSTKDEIFALTQPTQLSYGFETKEQQPCLKLKPK